MIRIIGGMLKDETSIVICGSFQSLVTKLFFHSLAARKFASISIPQ